MASMPRLRFPTLKTVTRTARFSFRPRELFFASRVEVSSMAFWRKARRWRCEQAPSALPRTAPAATPIRAIEGQDARNHRFARQRPLGEARGYLRPAGIGWARLGAHVGARRMRDRSRNPRWALWLCPSRSAAPHSRP